MYLNKATIGGFNPGTYLSSTDFNATSLWAQFFTNGLQANFSKLGSYGVRAIRSF
jgi:hypothetical protein